MKKEGVPELILDECHKVRAQTHLSGFPEETIYFLSVSEGIFFIHRIITTSQTLFYFILFEFTLMLLMIFSCAVSVLSNWQNETKTRITDKRERETFAVHNILCGYCLALQTLLHRIPYKQDAVAWTPVQTVFQSLKQI